MRLAVFFVLFVLSIDSAICQPKSIPDLKQIPAFCENFMQKFKDNKISEAIELMKDYSVIDPAELDKMGILISNRIARLGDSYGKILSYEFIEEKNIKEFLLKRVYMLRFEKSCLKFDFRFYNGGSGWTVNHFNFTEQLEEFFK